MHMRIEIDNIASTIVPKHRGLMNIDVFSLVLKLLSSTKLDQKKKKKDERSSLLKIYKKEIAHSSISYIGTYPKTKN